MTLVFDLELMAILLPMATPRDSSRSFAATKEYFRRWGTWFDSQDQWLPLALPHDVNSQGTTAVLPAAKLRCSRGTVRGSFQVVACQHAAWPARRQPHRL